MSSSPDRNVSSTAASLVADLDDEKKYSSFRWILLGFLIVLNVFNMVDRQIISALAVPISKAIDASDFGLGLLSGYAFSILYSVMGLYLGVMADRVNRIRLIAGGLFLWSLATAMSGVAQAFHHMLMARIFVGIGEATLTPAAISMLMEVFPSRQRSFAAGAYYAGLPIGMSASFLVAAKLEPLVGWRYCFFILGGIGIMLAVVVLMLRDSRPSKPLRGSLMPVLQSLGQLPGVLWRSPPLMLTMIGGCALNTSVGATLLDVKWMHDHHHFEAKDAAWRMCLFFLIGGLPGNLLGGWLGGFVEKRLQIHRLNAVLIMMLVSVPMMVVYRSVDRESPWLWISYFFTAMSIAMYYGPVFSTVTDLSPSHMKSTVVGFFLVVLNLLGISLGAILAPTLGKVFGDLTQGLLVTGLLNLLCVPAFLLAMWFLAKRKKLESSHVRSSHV